MYSRFVHIVLITAASLVLSSPAPLLAQRDGAISESIAERVVAAWDHRPSGIIVKVDDGVVEMWGEAPSKAGIDQAERIARSTYGVQDVVSHLYVRQPDNSSQAARQTMPRQPQPQAVESRQQLAADR